MVATCEAELTYSDDDSNTMFNTNDTNNDGTQKFVHDDGKHMLPPFPQTPVLAHVAREWIEKVKPKLAGAGTYGARPARTKTTTTRQTWFALVCTRLWRASTASPDAWMRQGRSRRS